MKGENEIDKRNKREEKSRNLLELENAGDILGGGGEKKVAGELMFAVLWGLKYLFVFLFLHTQPS